MFYREKSTANISRRNAGQVLNSLRGKAIVNMYNQLSKISAEVMKHLDDTTCVEGTTASLECTVAGAKYVAKWFKDGNEIVYDRRSRQEVKLSNEMDGSKIYIYTLTVLKVTHDDTGTYKLQLGNKTYECSLSVTGKIIQFRQCRNKLNKHTSFI